MTAKLVFGIKPHALKGKMLRNRHSNCRNRVVDVVYVGNAVFIYIDPGTSHDMWTPEQIENHYYPPIL